MSNVETSICSEHRVHSQKQPTMHHHLQALSHENEQEFDSQLVLKPSSHAHAAPYPPDFGLVASKSILSFTPNDPGNPYNWSSAKKAAVVVLGVIAVLNSTVGSSLSSGDLPALAAHFMVTDEEQLVLPNSIYLVGYILGPLLFAPLSESYGRQIVTMGTFGGLTLFSLATCFSPNWPAFIIFRFLVGTFASSPISVTGGMYADLYRDHVTRGRAMAMFMNTTTFGPVLGPIASGYLSVYYGWRFPWWFALALAVASAIPLAFVPETYGPTILLRRAKKLRKSNPGTNVYAPIELERKNFWAEMGVILLRPLRMFFLEPMVLFSCLFLSLIYGILYMFFQAFPIIYGGTYHFSLGEQGLAFTPIGIGSCFSLIIYLCWDFQLERAKAKNQSWAWSEDYRRLPLGCIGGPFLTLGLFWIGWTARPSVPWIVPVLGGLPFGCGFVLLFMSLINWLVDAYGVFAASAMAATACSRSLFGMVLPFAARPMYEQLGVAWASSLLGFISLAMCLIPFGFLRYGVRIRLNSKFCQELAAKEQQLERQAKEKEARAVRREQGALTPPAETEKGSFQPV